MRVLTTLSSSFLMQNIAEALRENHSVRMIDRISVRSDIQIIQSELDHGLDTNQLVKGMDSIIHPGWTSSDATASEQLDYLMRCTYNLFQAAREEGVPRVIYLSSLKLMEGYDPDLAVTERWKPIPTSDIPVLGCYLGEIVCREFAREGRTNVVILRLGELTKEDDPSPSTSALYVDDAIQAVEKSLIAETSGWLDIFHIQSDVENARFLTGQPWWSSDDVHSAITIGYKPRIRWPR